MPRVYASCSTGGEKRRKKRKAAEVTAQFSGLIDKFVKRKRISNNETDILLSEDSDDGIGINMCTDASEPATIRPPDACSSEHGRPIVNEINQDNSDTGIGASRSTVSETATSDAHNLTDGIDIEVVTSDTGSDASRSTTSETATSDACNSKDGIYIIDTDGDAARPTASGVSDAINFSISSGISINLDDETTICCNNNEPVTCHANTSVTTGAAMNTNMSNDPGSWQKLTQNEINELIRCGPPKVPNGFVYPTDPLSKRKCHSALFCFTESSKMVKKYFAIG